MPLFSRAIGVGVALLAGLLDANGATPACDTAAPTAVVSSVTVSSFVEQQRKEVLTFVGYSGAGYEAPATMLAHASRVLDAQDPGQTLVNIGATAEGIGMVYELARAKGFNTIGIVSTLARDEGVPISPCVDFVFFIPDSQWGGRLSGSNRLSPTSAAIVANTTTLVAIGGGDIARDELLAARRAGKSVTFLAADMNHQIAIDKAQSKGLPEPTDFRGSAHTADAPDCSAPVTQADMNRCPYEDFLTANGAQAAVLKNLADGLAAPDQKRLRTAQRSWIAWRTAQCEFESGGSSGGSAHELARWSCTAKFTRERTGALEKLAACPEGDSACPRRKP